MGMQSTCRTAWVASQPQLVEGLAEGIVGEQAPDQWVAYAQNELDSLGGLQHANGPGQHPQYTGLGTVGGERGRGRLWKETAIAWADIGLKNSYLPLEAENAAV